MKHELTPEQNAIIATDEDLKVNAVAGSGKTTTLIEYAATRDFGKKLLYLVFNKSAKKDADSKFRKAGIRSVTVQTAHSLAYQRIMSLPTYSLNHSGNNSHQTMLLVNISGTDRYSIANHVNQYMSQFCNSPCESLEDLDYMRCVGLNNESANFAKRHLKLIQEKTLRLWKMMDTAEIEVTHEFYLKKYQLSKPQLPYDYILFDEGQDASPVMLDVFLNQQCTKVIVGDTHQQIYSWRGAVNSLEQVGFKSLPLSKSFRFGTYIAQIAKNIIAEKGFSIDLHGVGSYANENINSEATISRTNICLLDAMVRYTNDNPEDPIYYEGNINALIFAQDGSSIYDIMNLLKDNRQGIRSKFIKSFDNFKALEKYAKQANDREIGIMVTMAEKYGGKLGKIMEGIKQKCVEDPDDAVMAFSTTHKSKGLEYDRVFLAQDFAVPDPEEPVIDEEINILYVAVTRAKKIVVLPSELSHYLPDFEIKTPISERILY